MATTKTTTKATTKTTTKKTATKAATKTAAKAEGKTLIIAEKPSVAADLVKVLGAKSFKKETAYYESDTTIVSHAIGHLVGIADPKDINEKYKAWDMKTP